MSLQEALHKINVNIASTLEELFDECFVTLEEHGIDLSDHVNDHTAIRTVLAEIQDQLDSINDDLKQSTEGEVL